jgi:hypothetical protein
MAVRTTVHLDERLLLRVRRLVPERGLSRFINEAVAAKADEVERERVEAEMKEGYLATRTERAALNKDWGAIDTERWPE